MTMHPALLTCAAAVLAVLIVAPLIWRLRATGRRTVTTSTVAARSRTSLPDYAVLLDAIARRVRSGSSLTSAVVDEIDRTTPLSVVVDRLAQGGSLASALARVTPGHADLSLTVQALSATAHLGGPVAATLDDAAAVLRERAAARAERRAHGSQARLSARVLTVVPLVFAAWSAVASERTRDIYLSSFAGTICALFGLALNVAGWRWMKRTIGAT
jgi:Flp pilus assembly protein TadB